LVLSHQGDAYRLSAEIEHQQGDHLAEAGLYFGHHRLARYRDAQLFCLLGFNDQTFMSGNPAAGTAQSNVSFRMASSIGPDIRTYSPWLAWEPFTPATRDQPPATRRRLLEVEVTSAGVTCSWKGHPLRERGVVPWADVLRDAPIVLKDLPPDPEAVPRPVTIPEVLRGGLGVYVRNGAAVFHQVEIKPLP
jgi:hypothetical protein